MRVRCSFGPPRHVCVRRCVYALGAIGYRVRLCVVLALAKLLLCHQQHHSANPWTSRPWASLRIADAVAAEYWDTVDYVSIYHAFGPPPRTFDVPRISRPLGGPGRLQKSMMVSDATGFVQKQQMAPTVEHVQSRVGHRIGHQPCVERGETGSSRPCTIRVRCATSCSHGHELNP
jgi:hypothetical protein